MKSVGFQRCPSCGGSWYRADRLGVLKEREAHGDYRWIHVDLWRDEERFRAGRQERLSCPKDRQTMTTVRYGDSRVRVDICANCRGVWLDAREYDAILRYLEKTVDSQTVGDFLEDLRDEALEIVSVREGVASEVMDFLKVLHLLELRFVVQHRNIATALRTASRGVPGS
jgi:Zn-finger nucleic acid-binding protein